MHDDSTWKQLGRLSRPVWILFAGTLVNRFGSFVLPFLFLYLISRGFSLSDAGLAAGFYGVGHLVASIAGGMLADGFGRRNTIALSMFSSAATMLALPFAQSLPATCALVFAAGLTAELYRPAAGALIADLVPIDHRVTAFAVYRLAINAGVAAGTAAGGFVAEKSFLYLFWGDAATSIVYGIIALSALPSNQPVVSRQTGWIEAVRSARSDVRFLRFLAASTCISTVMFQIESTFALHVKDLGFPTSTFGVLVAFNGLIIILFELVTTSYTRRWPRNRAIAIGYILVGLGFAATGLADTLPLLLLTVVIWTCGEMIALPLSATAVADLAPINLRGRYTGLYTATWSVGMTLGPLAGPLLYGYSPSLAWLLCGFLGVLAALLVSTPERTPPLLAVESR